MDVTPIGFYPNGDPIFKCEECGLCGDDCACSVEIPLDFDDEDFFFEF